MADVQLETTQRNGCLTCFLLGGTIETDASGGQVEMCANIAICAGRKNLICEGFLDEEEGGKVDEEIC